jgi:hypothetical protein
MSRKRAMTAVAMGMFLLLAPTLEAQQRPTLETMLDDASYVFNRYDELTTGVICDSWKVDDSLKRTCKQELRSIASNVEHVKVVLRRASKSSNPELVDLLDIYSELDEVSGHLYELSNNLDSFTSVSGVPYSEAAAKANILAANLYLVLRLGLITQSEKVRDCNRLSNKTPLSNLKSHT